MNIAHKTPQAMNTPTANISEQDARTFLESVKAYVDQQLQQLMPDSKVITESLTDLNTRLEATNARVDTLSDRIDGWDNN